jgi:nitroreductase
MNMLNLAQRRHSPRAFDGNAVDQKTIFDALEVARLSSSSYNNQPWRFVVAMRGEPAFDALLDTAVEANRAWMQDAGAIVGIMASTVLEKTGETDHAAMFGVGMAVGAMELALTEAGLASMQAGGFDRKAFRALLNLDDQIIPISLLAIGNLPSGHVVPEKQRKSLEDLLLEVINRR